MIWRQSSPVSTDVLVNQRQLMPGRPAYYCCLKLLNCFWKQRSSWSEEIRSKVLPTGCRVHYSHKMIVQTSDFYWSSDWKIFRYLLFRYLLLIIWLEDLATSVCYWWSDWWMLRCVCGPRCWMDRWMVIAIFKPRPQQVRCLWQYMKVWLKYDEKQRKFLLWCFIKAQCVFCLI